MSDPVIQRPVIVPPPPSSLPPPSLHHGHDHTVSLATASPRRLSVTLPLHAYRLLERLSFEQGRSMSNLAAFLIETGLIAPPAVASELLLKFQ